MDLLIELIKKSPFVFFEKYPEIRGPDGRIYFDLSPYQLMAFLCDNGLMTGDDGTHIKIMPLIRELLNERQKVQFNKIHQEQYKEIACGGADLIKLDNIDDLIDFNFQFKNTYLFYDEKHELTISLLGNPDGIIRYEDKYYYVNKESNQIKPLQIYLSSEEDNKVFQQFNASFDAMLNYSSRRSSDEEHSLIKKVFKFKFSKDAKCSLVRQGIRYEENGIGYRDSQAPFNNLLNTYRICIRHYVEARVHFDAELLKKAHEYLRKNLGTAQAKSAMWILQRFFEKIHKQMGYTPENFDSFKREFRFYNSKSTSEDKYDSVLVDGCIVAGLGSDFALRSIGGAFASSGADIAWQVEMDFVAVSRHIEQAKANMVEFKLEEELHLSCTL